jgi:competence protein ComEA
VLKVLKILPISALLLMLAAPALPRQMQSRGSAAHSPVPSADAPIDINHASIEELIQVPGLARSWAERMVRFRPYRSKLDLEQDGVLPGELYNRIKDYIIAHRDKK